MKTFFKNVSKVSITSMLATVIIILAFVGFLNFAEFAVSVCRQIGLLHEQDQFDSTLNFCKGISS